MNFRLDNFIATCLQALKSDKPQETVTEVLGRAVTAPDSITKELGKPTRAGIQKLYVSDVLTVVNVVWAPKMTLMPHNHNVWAVIGVYEGREDNIFWRRIKGDAQGRIEAAGARSIATGEAVPLGRNLIHSVTNPISAFTAAIHVYGGNFYEIERSEWEPLQLIERPYDITKNLNLFEAENAIAEYRQTTS